MIQNTFDTFHKHTCLRFLPRKYERQYLSIENRSRYGKAKAHLTLMHCKKAEEQNCVVYGVFSLVVVVRLHLKHVLAKVDKSHFAVSS